MVEERAGSNIWWQGQVLQITPTQILIHFPGAPCHHSRGAGQ